MIDSTTVSQQPAGVSATFRDGGGIIVTFGPKGVWRGHRGHLLTSLLLTLGGLVLCLKFTDLDRPTAGWLLPPSVVAAGLYLLASTMRRGRVRTVVTAGDDGLVVQNFSPLGSSTRSWSLSEISAVTGGEFCSAFVTAAGADIRLPLDRSRPEVLWLVKEVRRALRLPVRSSQRPPLPSGSRMRWRKDGDVATITMPSERSPFLLITFCLAVGVAAFVARLIAPRPGDDVGAVLGMIGLQGAGLVITILVLLGRIRSATVFEVWPTGIALTRPILFGSRRRAWPRARIETVAASSLGLSLWYSGKKREAVRVRWQGTAADYHWVAATLRHEMSLAAEP